eukprot:GHVS01068204.1.p1 GENE.GHVS01068204.1~~GHVS01068204.1.p1  ORF type:complete len:687 (-),score=63.73 GHVS01068204.1:1823-3727(-)
MLPLLPVGIPPTITSDVLVNDMYAILTGLHANSTDTALIESLTSRLDPTDQFFTWRGTVPQTLMSKTDPKYAMTTTLNVSAETECRAYFGNKDGAAGAMLSFGSSRAMVYLVKCHQLGCRHIEYTRQDFLFKLRQIDQGSNGPFAVLLSRWIDAGQDKLDDPWNSISLVAKRLVLENESRIVHAEIDEKREDFDGSERDCFQDANRHFVSALMKLQIYQQKQMRLDEVAEAWEHTHELDIRNNGMENALKELQHRETVNGYSGWSKDKLETTRMSLSLLRSEQEKVFQVKALRYNSSAEFVHYGNLDIHNSAQMAFIRRMWDQLYKQETEGVNVYHTRSVLIAAGQAAFSGLTRAGGAVWYRFKCIIEGAFECAFQNKIDRLSRYAIQEQLLDPHDLPDEQFDRVDVLVLEELQAAVQQARQILKNEGIGADDILRKFKTVFGDIDDTEPLNMSKAEMDSIEMARVAKRKGYLYGDTLKQALPYMHDAVGIFDDADRRYKRSMEALKRGNREDLPREVAAFLNEWTVEWFPLPHGRVYYDESRFYPQMVLDIRPTSKLFDTWYRLFIEALKDAFASIENWHSSNWDFTTLPDSVDKSNPHFIANKDLEGVLLPRFMVDFCLRQIKSRAPHTVIY